jgi:uncharacterized UBP type Zn finger protein
VIADVRPLTTSRYDVQMSACQHITKITKEQFSRKPNTPNGCEECLKMGDTWVHLRECLTCGHVGCCDSSKNKHATKHFGHTKHPVIKSLEPGERWMWCYVDEADATI